MPDLLSFFITTRTPANTVSSSPLSPATKANEHDEWTTVSHADAIGNYTDRILLLLAPTSTPYTIFIPDIPQSSHVLIQLAALPTDQRFLYLPSLTVTMLESYITTRFVDVLVGTPDWKLLIDLAKTAEVLIDEVMHANVMTALRKKASAVGRDGDDMFSPWEYGLVVEFAKATGGGATLLEMLDEVTEKVFGKKTISSASARKPVSGGSTGIFGLVGCQTAGKECRSANSVLWKHESSALSTLEYKNDGNYGKEYPVRQATLPPGVEALRSGTMGNFSWPNRKKLEHKI
ncbi:hypothetical protein NX059_003516 [Plenodomus lindquistii]|nr:hypothetical protein NX059_003516 [Plenodomus lindquistii]